VMSLGLRPLKESSMKVRTELRAGVAVGVGAAAVNVSELEQHIYSSISGAGINGGNSITQTNAAAVTQSATAMNSGAVAAANA